MRLFGWVQNKLNGKPVNKKPNSSVPATNQIHTKQEHREEFSDWPHGLLAIGTFGNTNSEIKQESENNIKENPSSSLEEEIVELTAEEVGKLQKELTKLLSRKPNKEKEIAELPLDRFLNCPSSLELDRRISNALINNYCNESELDHHKLANEEEEEEEEENIERTISVIIGKCKDICAEKNKKAIGKKSISFLLKKMFVCRSGFAPAPCLRDTLQESRMEKILRMMLQKKMNPQNSSRPASSTAKKYLEDNKQMPKKSKNQDQDHEKKEKSSDEGCKWVKTDSEYIVLEM